MFYQSPFDAEYSRRAGQQQVYPGISPDNLLVISGGFMTEALVTAGGGELVAMSSRLTSRVTGWSVRASRTGERILEIGYRKGGGLGVHTAWRVGDTAMHANGTKPLFFLTKSGRRYANRAGLTVREQLRLQRLSTEGAADFLSMPGVKTIRLPALNPSLAIQGEGSRCMSCVTSAWTAWSRANYHIPNITIGAGVGLGIYEVFAENTESP